MAVAWASSRWSSPHSGSRSTELSARSPRGVGPSCIPLHILHMTLMHHCRSQPSLRFCLVLSSCHDGHELLVAHELSIACPGFGARRLHSLTCHSSDVIFRSGDSVSGCFFLHNSSIGLTHWCAHQSGPIRPIRSRVGAIFPFPFPSDSSTNLCLFCLHLVFSLTFSPFLASYFLCQCTTFPHVTTVHNCRTLLLLTRNSLPCVSTVHAGKSIHCTVPLLIFLFLLSVSSNLLTSPLLVLHRRLRRSPSFPIVSMFTSGHPVEFIIIQSIALRFTSS